MAIERTLILCKPDAVSRGLIGEITARIERRGYIISAMKLLQLDGDRAREHYAEHEGKAFFTDLVDFITNGPLVAMAVEGASAIEGCRQLIGATNPLDAPHPARFVAISPRRSDATSCTEAIAPPARSAS